MSESMHSNLLVDARFYSTNRFDTYDAYTPLTAQEFRSISTNELLQSLPDDKLERIWLIPIQRMLQQVFRIDQRVYSTASIPTLEALAEDFKVAAAITVDKFSRNEDEKIGEETVDGVGKSKSDLEIPQRARQLLHRYERPGGRVGRA